VAEAALDRHYGLRRRLYEGIGSKLGVQTVYIEITPVEGTLRDMLPDDRQAGLIAGGRPTINLNERSRKVRFVADRLEVASVGDRPVYDTNEGSAMATYVALIDWTDRGVQAFKDSVDRYESAQSQMRAMGVEFTNIYWTLGSHDIVSVVEAPDDQTLAAALLAVAGQGNIRTTTLRAFSADEMREVISKAG